MRARIISLEKCKYYFDFDEQGNLYWKNVNRNRHVKNGDIAGFLHKSSGYYVVKLENVFYSQHRVLYQLYNNVELKENEEIDHRDRNRKNNTKENLRICDRSENRMNTTAYKNNSTGYKNITYREYEHHDSFVLSIKNKKHKKNNFYREYNTDKYTLQEVIETRDKKLLEIHGDFANYS